MSPRLSMLFIPLFAIAILASAWMEVRAGRVWSGVGRAVMWLGMCAFQFGLMMKARRAEVVQERKASGLCPACGYDLRASPDRCPECGADAVKSALSEMNN